MVKMVQFVLYMFSLNPKKKKKPAKINEMV